MAKFPKQSKMPDLGGFVGCGIILLVPCLIIYLVYLYIQTIGVIIESIKRSDKGMLHDGIIDGVILTLILGWLILMFCCAVAD